jgi:hypothetical protein
LDFSAQGLPLLKIEGRGSSPSPGKPISTGDWKLSLTSEGKAVIASIIPQVLSATPLAPKPDRRKASSISKRKK